MLISFTSQRTHKMLLFSDAKRKLLSTLDTTTFSVELRATIRLHRVALTEECWSQADNLNVDTMSIINGERDPILVIDLADPELSLIRRKLVRSTDLILMCNVESAN